MRKGRRSIQGSIRFIDRVVWIGGLALITSFFVVILGEDRIADQSMQVILLSTVAIVQGMGVNAKKSASETGESDQAIRRVNYFSSAAAILHLAALITPAPISYVFWGFETLCFFVAAHALVLLKA